MAGEEAAAAATSDSATVFVSYSRDDRKRALPIIAAIEDAGFKVWWDGLLGGGERFFETTAEALEAARAVVVLWSRVSVKSHWVHDEATRGRDKGILVPVTIDGTPPPLGFGQYQTVNLARAKMRAGDPEMDAVLTAIASLHESERRQAQRVATAARGIDRRLLLGGIAGAAVAGGGLAWLGGFIGSGARTNSIAVLPFDNLSGDPAQSYFSDGVAAQIRSELARNPLLQVAAQASSESFRGVRDDAQSIARKLGVLHLLGGNIRKSGDQVRISVELTDGAKGFSKWSESFDRPLADVFAVQDEIADAVTAALSLELDRAKGKDAPAKGGTKNFAAYDAYLKGTALYALSTGEKDARDALTKFEEAVARDPDYAAAWSARSRTLSAIANLYLKGTPRQSMFDAAIVAANRAIQLAPLMADAHSALGYATFLGRRNVREARAPYERSAELGQGEPDVLTRYAVYAARTANFEAARAASVRATVLDPLNPQALRSLGSVEHYARDYPASIAAYERALVLAPEMTGLRAAMGFSQLLAGDIDAAERSFASESSALRRLCGTAMVARRKGQTAAAEAALVEVEKEFGDTAVYEQAQILAQWGDTDRGIARLIRAAETGDPGIILIRTDPLIDSLRKRPEFSGLLKRAGFE